MPDLISSLISNPQALSDLLERSASAQQSVGPTAGGGMPFPQQQAQPQQPPLPPPPGARPPLQVPQISPQAPQEAGFAALEGLSKLTGPAGKEIKQHLDMAKQAAATPPPPPPLTVPQLVPPPGQQPTPQQPHMFYSPGERGAAQAQQQAPLMQQQNEMALQQRHNVMNWLTSAPEQGGLGIDIAKLSPQQQAAIAGLTLPATEFHEMQPGTSAIYGGKTIFGPPKVEMRPEGSTAMLVNPAAAAGQPVETGATPQGIPPLTPPPGTQPQNSGVTEIRATAPRLSEPEVKMMSAAQQVAAKHGLPFDPAKNPRNPFLQIPTRYHAEVRALDAEQNMDPTMRASTLAMRNSLEGLRGIQEENARNQRTDRSYTFHVGEMDKLSKPITDLVGRFGRLEDTLAQGTPQADALVAPELLSVMAGGAGSGLRMNEAEIARIVGGRSHWEDLKAAINKWSLDPKAARSITPEQQRQIQSLASTVGNKLRQKQALIDETNQTIVNANDPQEHRKALMDLKKKLTDIDAGKSLAPLQPPPGGRGPAVGTVEGGYRFKGGDAGKPENWEKVK